MKFAVLNTKNATKFQPFDTVKKTIIAKLKENATMIDVAQALQDEKPIDMDAIEPQRQKSTIDIFDTDNEGNLVRNLRKADERSVEQSGFDIKYEREVAVWTNKKQDYEKGMISAYSKIMNSHTTKQIKSKVEQLANYAADIENKPIELLDALRKLAHDGSTVTYIWKTVFTSMLRLTQTKMDDDESIQDFEKRVKSAYDVFLTHVGKHWLEYALANDDAYKQATTDQEKQQLAEVASEEMQAYIMLHGAHQLKYGSAKQNLLRDASLQNEQYPKTLSLMKEHLAHHQWDQAWFDYKKKKRQDRERSRRERDRDDDQQVQLAQAGRTPMICHCCGEPGHISPKCPKRNEIPRQDWYQNKAIQAYQHANDDDDQSEADQTEASASSNRRSETSSRARSAFQSLQFQGTEHEICLNTHFANKEAKEAWSELRDLFVLDSASTFSSFCNLDLCTDIRISKNPIHMATNIGSKRIDLDCTVPGIIKAAKADPSGIANIIGIKGLIDAGFTIVMDTSKELCFIVYFPEDTARKDPVKFNMTKEGLFVLKPSENYLKMVAKSKNMTPPVKKPTKSEQKKSVQWRDIGDDGTQATEPETDYDTDSGSSDDDTVAGNDFQAAAVDTVKDNMKFHTDRQISDAKRARDLMTVLGCTPEKLKLVIKQRLIEDNPVTVAHVDLAHKIFGKDIPSLKGKSTRSKPKAVVDDHIEIPREIYDNHPELVMEIDITYLNKLPMLVGIDTTIKNRSFEALRCRKVPELQRALNTFIRAYNRAGFRIQRIDCDNEFKPLFDDVEARWKALLNFANPGDHCPHIERSNRTIKEGVRTLLHGLPFKYFPRLMIRKAGERVTFMLNLLPAKGGVSDHLSPRTIMTAQNLKYSRDLKYPFGCYVQAEVWTNPRNSNLPRTLDCIYFQPAQNRQEGHELMHIQTGELVTARKLTQVPITDAVKSAVERLAKRQGMRQSIKIESRVDIPIVPADWIAGVEHDLYQSTPESDDSDSEDEDYDGDDSDSDDSDDELSADEDIQDDEVHQLTREEVTGRMTNSNPINNQTDDVETGEDENEQHESEVEDEDQEAPELQEPSDSDDDSDDSDDEGPDGDPTDDPEEEQVIVFEDEDRRPVFEDETIWNQRPHREPQPRNILTYGAGHTQTETQLHQLEKKHLLLNQVSMNPEMDEEYDDAMAPVIAFIIDDINNRASADGASFAQQHLLHEGLKLFGEEGEKATIKEADQLHRRTCFKGIRISDMTREESMRAVRALMLLTPKRDGTVKGRMVFDGSQTRSYIDRDETSSPTATQESIVLTAVIDAKEQRDNMAVDVPNAFIQEHLPNADVPGKRVIMKITGVLIDYLVRLAPDEYGPFVVMENGKRVLYLQVLKALYGMLVAALLWYKKFKRDLESIGFVFNPYDPCVANRTIRGKQHTVRFHVDDLWSSHVDPKVNDEFLIWLNKMYGSHGEVKANRSKKFDYLGVNYDLSEPGVLKMDMIEYVKAMVNDFPVDLKDETEKHACPPDLIKEGTGAKLDKDRHEAFHTFVAKGLFACKRARPDIHPAIAVLCTRVNSPTESDWGNLLHMMRFLNRTKEDKLILRADNLHILKWYVDASFAVHPDFRSHTGAGLTLGKGFPITMSRKQKLNTRSSTESELVGADDASQLILWTKLFMEAQGYEIEKNILYQDNKSTIQLLKNGKQSSSKRTRAINIRYFFLTDQIEKGNLMVEYCPTKEMWADFMTKPLQGQPEVLMRGKIMGHE